MNEFSKNTQVSNFIKIRPVGAELFDAGGRPERHDKGFRSSANAPNSERSKWCCIILLILHTLNWILNLRS